MPDIRRRVIDKAGSGVSPTGAKIGNVGINRDQRRTRVDQLFCKATQEGRAVAAADHVGFANEGVDGAGASGQMQKLALRS